MLLQNDRNRRFYLYAVAIVLLFFAFGLLVRPLTPSNSEGKGYLSGELPVEQPHTDAPVADTAKSDDETIVRPSTPLIGQGHDVSKYVEISSAMTSNGQWFPLVFGDYGSYNPNILPHPHKNDTWIMIAQQLQPPGGLPGPVYSVELVCEAVFYNNQMKCLDSPLSVPVASTASTHCTESLDWFNLFIGPNDPRVFVGPDGTPYITYGSASQYTCLGQWIHDLRRLVKGWSGFDAIDATNRFFWPTELQRPSPYGSMEKNWFAFWDERGDMYLHYDILPSRVFAKVSPDGSSISEDLAPLTAASDSKCLEKNMPKLQQSEHIHQATNSLAISLCKRSDLDCQTDQNTYIFTILHHKVYHGHNLYEPYVMLFKQSAPFEIHAIASKPFWIAGRGEPGGNWRDEFEADIPADQSQMMYITSMNWKSRDVYYHGYLDDELIISFGVEDVASGAIDVVVGDLIRDLNFCNF